MATYRHDPDLEFLRHCHRDDLDLLVSVLICPKDGEARITKYSFNHGDDRDGKVKRVLRTSPLCGHCRFIHSLNSLIIKSESHGLLGHCVDKRVSVFNSLLRNGGDAANLLI
ncbi:DUF3944 domain-containing protein [Escherichia coli]|uniref:DUF3944 domain-containing protein n=1 Tax=Escherichia coli TaxID=562 RepID=UPI002022C111|nr:DUF3944 domain-containing protein [Escherichia coli]